MVLVIMGDRMGPVIRQEWRWMSVVTVAIRMGPVVRWFGRYT